MGILEWDTVVKVGMTWETHWMAGDGLGWVGDRWDSLGIKLPNPVCQPNLTKGLAMKAGGQVPEKWLHLGYRSTGIEWAVIFSQQCYNFPEKTGGGDLYNF